MLAREPGFDETQLAHHPMRHVLTNVVGARDDTDVEVGERALASGDMLLLCSDGLYGGLDDASLQLLMATAGQARRDHRAARADIPRAQRQRQHHGRYDQSGVGSAAVRVLRCGVHQDRTGTVPRPM